MGFSSPATPAVVAASLVDPVTLAPGSTVTTDASSLTNTQTGSVLQSIARAAIVYENGTVQPTGTVVPRGRFDVSIWESIQLRAFTIPGRSYYVQLDFYTSLVDATPVGSIIYQANDGQEIADSIPVLGPYMTVTTRLSLTEQLWLIVTARKGPAGAASSPGGGLVLAFGPQTVAPAGTHTRDAAAVRPGPATVTVLCSAVTWRMSIAAVNYSGLVVQVGGFHATNVNQITQEMILPPMIIQATVVNLSAANADFYVGITPLFGK